MKKISLKYIVLSSFSIGLIIAFIFLITNFLLRAISPGFTWEFVIILIASLVGGALVTLGISTLSPLVSDWVIVLRKLIRFDNLSHPLIQRLSYEAPGTYHHSINVSIMGQQAAKSIGADSLLVRIAAYYHDIGKLEDPMRFIENQAGHEIPKTEDERSIKESALQIIKHVKDGIAIGQSYDLPQNVLNLIEEHHGTTKVLYFYELAKEQKIKFKLTDFKYPGPIPQTKEAAILMLADSIEAAARASIEFNDETIKQIVASVTADKISEKQLNHCNLTKRELDKLKFSFMSTLASIFHQRIIRRPNESN